MKKNGRRWRKEQKEKEEKKRRKKERKKEAIERQKANMKYPFKTAWEVCTHFHRESVDRETGRRRNRPLEEYRGWWQNGFVAIFSGYYNIKISDLIAISDTQCQCRICGKVFPIEKIEQMERLFKRLNELYELQERNRQIDIRELTCGLYRHSYDGLLSDILLDDQFLQLCDGIEPVWYRRVYLGEQEYFVDKKFEIEIGTELVPHEQWQIYYSIRAEKPCYLKTVQERAKQYKSGWI